MNRTSVHESGFLDAADAVIHRAEIVNIDCATMATTSSIDALVLDGRELLVPSSAFSRSTRAGVGDIDRTPPIRRLVQLSAGYCPLEVEHIRELRNGQAHETGLTGLVR